MGTNLIMLKQKSSAARPAADPNPKRVVNKVLNPKKVRMLVEKARMFVEDARMFVEDTQNPRGIILANQGRNKPPRWIEPNCVYPVIKKLMMMQLNASGVLAGNIRFVLRLALNSIYCWIQPL